MKPFAVLLLLVTFSMSACTSTRWVRTTLVEQPDFSVTLEQQEKKGQVLPLGYAHPHKIDTIILARLMGGLNYNVKSGLMRKQTQSPVFQPVEIERLVPALADALAQANAGQRIRFLSFNKEELVIFSVTRKTEGVIFVEPGGRLNIAFNFINAKRETYETNAVNPNYSAVDPLQIRYSETPIAADADYLETPQTEDGKPAPMWVVADLQKLKTSTGPVGKAAEEAPPPIAPKDEARTAPVENRTVGMESEDSQREEIRKKLKYLKALRDEGLISEDDFAAKKSQLLEKIQ